MKRKVTLIVILILFLLGLVFGVIYLNNPDIFSSPKEEQDFDRTTTIRYPVIKGEITHTYSVDAQVISNTPELYVTDITLEGITQTNFELIKKQGDEIKSGEALYKYEGKEKSVDFNGQLVDITYEKTSADESTVTIKLLNYDKLFIQTEIDIDKYEKINYDTKVFVTYDDNEYESKITGIGYEIADKKLPVKVGMPDKFLPGTEVKVRFILDVHDAGLYVPEDAIYSDGDNYYANILEEDDTTRQTQVLIGERFSETDGDHTFKYVELLSGVSENDTIVVEIVDDSGTNIKGNLGNE